MSSVVVIVCVGLLAVAALILLARATIGPTVLDRAIAFDVLVAVTVIAVALQGAVRRSTDTLVILVVLTLLGFIGSVAIARFIDPNRVARQAAGDDEGEDADDGMRGELH